MKKLMIAAAIVCAAAVSQGASILWGGDVAQSDGQSAVGAGSVAYLIRGATAGDAAVSVITAVGDDWSSWTTDTGATIVGSYTLDSSDASGNYHFDATYNIAGADDEGYYSVIVVDGEAGAPGKTGSYNYAGQNTLVDPTSGATVNLQVGDNWQTGANWIGKGGFNAVEFKGSSPVPEPTSGLLMLLGVAGLALRRRRA